MALNMEEMANEYNKIQSRGKGKFEKTELNWFKFERGEGVKNVFRVCPPGPDDTTFVVPRGKIAMPVVKHLNLPGMKESVRCLSSTYPDKGVQCPVCEAIHEMYRWFKAAGVDQKVQKQLLGQHRYYMRAFTNVIDRNETNYIDMETGNKIQVRTKEDREGKKLAPMVKLIALPKSVFDWLVEQVNLKDGDEYMWGDITDPKTGHDLVVSVNGEGIGTSYTPTINPKARPIEGTPTDPEVRDYVLKHMYDIGKIWQFPTGASYDMIVGAGAKLLSMIGASSNKLEEAVADSKGVPSRETSVYGTNVSTDEDGKPTCFGHHLDTADGNSPFIKCTRTCAFEGECVDETTASVEDCKKVHGITQ
jgi:hypothetical protein